MRNLKLVVVGLFLVMIVINVLGYFYTKDLMIISIGPKVFTLYTIFTLLVFIFIEFILTVFISNKVGAKLPLILFIITVMLNLWYIVESFVG